MSTRQPASPSAVVQLIRTFYLAVRLLLSPNVPLWTKIVPLAAVAYLIFPLDFLPDFLPGVGQVDDLTIILIAIWAFIQLCPKDVIEKMHGDSTRQADAKVVDGSYRVMDEDVHNAQAEAEQLPPLDRSR